LWSVATPAYTLVECGHSYIHSGIHACGVWPLRDAHVFILLASAGLPPLVLPVWLAATRDAAATLIGHCGVAADTSVTPAAWICHFSMASSRFCLWLETGCYSCFATCSICKCFDAGAKATSLVSLNLAAMRRVQSGWGYCQYLILPDLQGRRVVSWCMCVFVCVCVCVCAQMAWL